MDISITLIIIAIIVAVCYLANLYIESKKIVKSRDLEQDIIEIKAIISSIYGFVKIIYRDIEENGAEGIEN